MSRLIGILCAAYSGSTFMSNVLDGLPGVKATGEDHVLVDTSKIAESNSACRCGAHDCEIFPIDLGWRLSDSVKRLGWRGALEEHLASPVLVSSNKWLGIYDRCGMHPDEVLLLWKDPRNWVISWMDRNPGCSVKEATFIWNRYYSEAMNAIERTKIPCCCMCLDDFVRSPEHELKRICSELGLECDPCALDTDSVTHHHVRGNSGVRKGILKDSRWKKGLGDKRARMVMNSTEEVRSRLLTFGRTQSRKG